MSRLGKLPVIIPAGVKLEIGVGEIKVNGPKGLVKVLLHKDVIVEVVDDKAVVSVKDLTVNKQKALWGLTRMLLANAVLGVTQGFSKTLELIGVGFKAQVQGQKIILNLGFSHPIEFQVPVGISVTQEKNSLTLSGIDKQLVGQVAAEIRALKKPEPYKGKGIKYSDEVVRRKAGKIAKAAAK